MYQPALLSSSAKLLLGCISIAISNQTTTPVPDHRGPIFRRLVCRSPTNSISPRGKLLVRLQGTRKNLNEVEGTSCHHDFGLIAA